MKNFNFSSGSVRKITAIIIAIAFPLIIILPIILIELLANIFVKQ